MSSFAQYCLYFGVSKDSDLLVGQGTLCSIFIVAQTIVFLLFLNAFLVFGRAQKMNREVVGDARREMGRVE